MIVLGARALQQGPDLRVERVEAAKRGRDDGQDFLPLFLHEAIARARVESLQQGRVRQRRELVAVLLPVFGHGQDHDVARLAAHVHEHKDFDDAPQPGQVRLAEHDHEPLAAREEHGQAAKIVRDIALVDAALIDPL